MEKVSVKASKNYDILIGHKLLENSTELIKNVSRAKTAAIITDDIVDKLYSKKLESSLKKSNLKYVKFVFNHGEENKTIKTVSDILSFLAKNEITRSDIVIALGGGIVGDAAGFSAACYLRGIDFIQIPTTLLAAVDSSVGGKTGVNLGEGKNLAGAFHQPSLVICDCDCFKTLSDEIFADGISESIKYGIICDEKLFDKFKNEDAKKGIQNIIKTCVEIKSDIVSRDEFDTGERQKLNLGHTVGHAIEKCSSYEISHGHAVSIGMVIAARAAYKLGLCDSIEEEIKAVLKKYNLPTESPFAIDELIGAMLRDKKRNADRINLILPTKIGECIIYPAEVSQLKNILE